MFTEQDAIDRVLEARVGSLDPRKINHSYLVKLKIQVDSWLERINDTIEKSELCCCEGPNETYPDGYICWYCKR